jgi:hypothetical protein
MIVTLIVQPRMCPPIVDLEACFIRVEEGPRVLRAWIVLEHGGEYELTVDGKILRFQCLERGVTAAVIVDVEFGGLRFWGNVELGGDETLLIADALPGAPDDISPELARELGLVAAGGYGTPSRGPVPQPISPVADVEPPTLEADDEVEDEPRVGGEEAGERCQPDVELSVCQRSCLGGDADSCMMLADRYRTGNLGATRNLRQAAKYYSLACDGGIKSGCAMAAEVLGVSAERNESIPAEDEPLEEKPSMVSASEDGPEVRRKDCHRGSANDADWCR